MNKIILFGASIALLAACKTTKDSGTTAVDPGKSNKQSTIDVAFLSTTVRPQDDFFIFSNENWIKENPVPPSESRWGSFNELDKANKEKITRILVEMAEKSGKKTADETLLGNYYTSYLDLEMRAKKGLPMLQAELVSISMLKDKAAIVEKVAELHKKGVGVFFSFGVGQDLKDVEKNITYFSQGGIGLPNRDYYFDENKEEIRTQYIQYIQNLSKLAGVSDDESYPKAKSVYVIETTLAKAMLAPAEMREPEKTYNKTSKAEFTSVMKNFAFDSYLKGTNALSFDTLVVDNPTFVKVFNDLILKTELADLKNYLAWHTTNFYAGHLGEDFVATKFKFYGAVLSGKKEMKPYSESVIDEMTNQEFGEVLGKAFVAKYFSENAKNKVNTMVDNLLIVFRDRINNLDWMSAGTKKEALNKLNSIGRKLGFPSKWQDFSELVFTPDNYMQNVLNSNTLSHQRNMKDLAKKVDKDKWGMPAHMVNAYYHPLLNEIAFPAGIMQPPFFDENAEDAVNYGRIGMVIGHEFTHGFDDMGSKFAADGSFKNWWSDEDRKQFEARTTTFGQTYEAFCPLDGHCVNPQLTMGENIADLGGLTMAYYAYKLTDDFKSGAKVEGFTPAQRFFIAYAQLWKINYTDAEMKNRIANDPHSPGMYRVNGPLMNCDEFFEAFNVKEGDKMRNPEKKVARIW
ncbi:MAG: M13 family metallopeptidase [Bacteroidota bacterium]